MGRIGEYSESFDALNDAIHERDAEIEELRERSSAWEAVARNLAQVLEGRTHDGISSLASQMDAHGIK